MTLAELADIADKANATLRVTWGGKCGYLVEFVARPDSSGDAAGAIGASDPDIDVAATAAIGHLATYTRPDGGVDWAPRRVEA